MVHKYVATGEADELLDFKILGYAVAPLDETTAEASHADWVHSSAFRSALAAASNATRAGFWLTAGNTAVAQISLSHFLCDAVVGLGRVSPMCASVAHPARNKAAGASTFKSRTTAARDRARDRGRWHPQQRRRAGFKTVSHADNLRKSERGESMAAVRASAAESGEAARARGPLAWGCRGLHWRPTGT